MAYVNAKLVAGLNQSGCECDIVVVEPSEQTMRLWGYDTSLSDYLERHCRKVHHVVTKDPISTPMLDIIRRYTLTDAMALYVRPTVDHLMRMELARYHKVISISPFHSVNLALADLKRRGKKFEWISIFCDPWANNPLIVNQLRRQLDSRLERRSLRFSDGLLHTSEVAMKKMIENVPDKGPIPLGTFTHMFDESLYPNKNKRSHNKFTIRHIGSLISVRSPLPLLEALMHLFERKPHLREIVRVELVGFVDPMFFASEIWTGGMKDIVHLVPQVPYAESLELMSSADLLVLIETNDEVYPFVPSKLVDYIGSGTNYICLTKNKQTRWFCNKDGAAFSSPTDVERISLLIETELENKAGGKTTRTRDTTQAAFRMSLSNSSVARKIMSQIGITA